MANSSAWAKIMSVAPTTNQGIPVVQDWNTVSTDLSNLRSLDLHHPPNTYRQLTGLNYKWYYCTVAPRQPFPGVDRNNRQRSEAVTTKFDISDDHRFHLFPENSIANTDQTAASQRKETTGYILASCIRSEMSIRRTLGPRNHETSQT